MTRPLPAVPGVTHSYPAVGDVRLHVASFGPPDAAPVVLLHGFPQHWYAWRHVAARLAADHHVLAVDQRGFGWSSTPKRGYDTATRAADLLALLDVLGLERVRLAGHEWGAWAGFAACLRAPERFTSFLALNIVSPWPRHRSLLPQAWRFWYTTVLEAPGLGRLAQRRWPAYTRFLLRGLPERDEYVAVAREPGTARAGEALHRQFVLHDIPRLALGRFGELRVPTLLLGGEHDHVFPPAMLRGSPVPARILPGAGHWLPEQRPDEVAAALRAARAADPAC